MSVPLVELDVSVLGSTSSAGTVWTGTQTGGVRTMASNCVGWTSDSDVGEVGEGGTISQWTDNGAQPCGSPAGLYCIEQ